MSEEGPIVPNEKGRVNKRPDEKGIRTILSTLSAHSLPKGLYGTFPVESKTWQWQTGSHSTHREKQPKSRQWLLRMLNFLVSKTGGGRIGENFA